ncbi:MAG: T9SS type A sorting domain-containing protein [Bacteroidota bacterium]
MKKIIFIFFIEALTSFDSFSQPLNFAENEQAHRRYWYYRTRFINDFVKIGEAQGDCICFPERNYNSSDGTSITAKVGPDQIDIMNQYLSALALEYKLLSRNNQSTDETIREIFYILKTINRLDNEADWFWSSSAPTTDHMSGYPQTVNLNGFILREDMPHDYFDSTTNAGKPNYKHFNYAITEYNSTATAANLSYIGLNEINQLTNDNKFSNYQNFPSHGTSPQQKEDLTWVHDKYQSMLIAFMLLVKYIPDGTGYYENSTLQTFQDGESDILQEVRNITNRCHPYIRGNRFGGTGSNWILQYPDGSNLPIGKDATPYSYPLAKMICYINSGYPFSPPCDSYQDLTSLTHGFTFYNLLPYNPIPSITPTLGSEDGAVFIGNCMAGSNAPVRAPNWSPLPVFLPVNIVMPINSGSNRVEWTELLRRVLHQKGTLMQPETKYTDPISTAPCTGPFNYTGGNDAGHDWKSQDRLEHPKSFYAPNTNAPPGNYPGVDYMLLHNLYYEYLNQQSDDGITELGVYKTAYNLMDNYDTRVWPRQAIVNAFGNGQSQSILIGVDANVSQVTNPPGPGTLLTTKQPAYIKVFQNLESIAKIYATTSPAAPNNTIPAKVEYRAGKVIVLKDGFEVRSGADFHAYIKRYVCAAEDYGSGMRQAQNTDQASNDYMSDYMNSMVTIHGVESPKSASDNYPYSSTDEEQYSTQEEFNAHALEQRTIMSPNPSSGIFHIQTKKISEEEILLLNVYDMKGQLIMSINSISSEQEINLEAYGNGIYMIQIISNTGRSMVKKIEVLK